MNKIIICLFIVSVFSCEKKNEDKISLDLSQRSKKIRYSEILDSIVYIDVENNKDCMIGNVDQFFKDDTLLFLLDRLQKTLFIFSDKGKFIRKLNRVGGAEGEYITITSFAVNCKTKRICLLDDMQQKILMYSYKFDYLKLIKFKQEEIIRSIGILPNENFIFFTPDQMPRGRDGVWEVDSVGKLVKHYKKVDSKHRFLFSPFPFYSQLEDKISFYDNFTNEIFSIENGKMINNLQFELRQKIPDQYLSKEHGVKNQGTDVYYMNNRIVETNNHYYLQFRSNKLGDVCVFFEKDTGKVFVSDFLENDIKTVNQSLIKFFNWNRQAMLAVVWGENPDRNPEFQILYLKNHFKLK